jgi:hypothetical protein
MRTSGAECDNNAVDAEALLGHTLGSLLNSVRDLFSRSELEAELFKLANSQLLTQGADAYDELPRIEAKMALLKEELALIGRNLARSKDQETYDEIEGERLKVKAEITDLGIQRERLVSRTAGHRPEGTTAQQEVERALSKLKDIQRIVSTPEGRMEVRSMLDELGIRVGLSFVGAVKGKKRPVRKLAGGIIVFGDDELPVKLHGKDRLDDGDGHGDESCDDDCHGDDSRDEDGDGDHDNGGGGHAGDAAPCYIGAADARTVSPDPADNNICEGENPPSQPDVFPRKCHQEEVSFTKVNRADWIRTSDLLTPRIVSSLQA